MMKSRGRYQESRRRSGAQWRGHIDSSYVHLSRATLRRRSHGWATRSRCASLLLVLILPSSRRKPGWPTIKSTRPNIASGVDRLGSSLVPSDWGFGTARAARIRLDRPGLPPRPTTVRALLLWTEPAG